jgi:hypothetical protein
MGPEKNQDFSTTYKANIVDSSQEYDKAKALDYKKSSVNIGDRSVRLESISEFKEKYSKLQT